MILSAIVGAIMALMTHELHYEPSMDRANEIREPSTYDPTQFPDNLDTLADVERKSLPGRLGLSGLIIVAVAGVISPLASSGPILGLAIAGIFGGWAVFGMANYMAYRLGERVWIQPDTSARVVVASVFLGLTAIVAGLVH
jgi:hypothetical protein